MDHCQSDLQSQFRRFVGAEAVDDLVADLDRRLSVAVLHLSKALVDQRRCRGDPRPKFQRLVAALAGLPVLSLDGPPSFLGEDGAHEHVRLRVRHLGERPLNAFVEGGELCCIQEKWTGQFLQFLVAVEHRHEADQALHHGRLVAFAPQLVVDAVKPFGSGVEPLASAPLRGDRATLDEPPEHGRDDADVQGGARRDFARGRRAPEIDRREIDAAFGPGQPLQMASKVFRVVVDQRHQFVHQLAQGPVPCESGDDHQQARAAAGQDFERPDAPCAPVAAACRLPQALAVLGVQRSQGDRAEQFEEGLARVLQSPETAGGGGDQHDPGFGLQRLAQPPPEIVVHALAQRLKVLDHEDQTSVEAFRRLQNGGAGAVCELALAPAGLQVGMGVAQFARQVRIRTGDLPGEMEQRFQPEIGEVENFMALLHEPHGQQARGKLLVGPELGGGAREQHGLAPAARCDDQNVLAGRRLDVSPEDVEHGVELVVADHELFDHVTVGLEQPWIELADGRDGWFVHRASLPRLTIRSARGAW